MSKHLERDLELLEREILVMSSMVEDVTAMACQAVRLFDHRLFDGVAEQERLINEREVQIEELSLEILDLHRPVAVDLRRVAAVLKINNDLERIADLAVNISERARPLAKFPRFSRLTMLDQMVTRATVMLRDALDAFVNLDVEAARQVCLCDDEVDEDNRRGVGVLQHTMRSDPEQVAPAMHYFSAARHVERIVDHATNIAEDVIYLVRGEIARHAIA